MNHTRSARIPQKQDRCNIYIYIYIYIYPQTRVSLFPGLTVWLGLTSRASRTDVTRVLKAPGAELCQNTCGVVNVQKIFCSYQCSPEHIYPQTRASPFPGLISVVRVNEYIKTDVTRVLKAYYIYIVGIYAI